MNPYKDLTDDRLMKLYIAGEGMAFDVLYERHKGKIYGYITKRLPCSDDAPEVFQNAFLKFHKSRHLYDPKYSVMQWLYTVTRSELLDFMKKKKIATVPLIHEPPSDECAKPDVGLEDMEDLSEKERRTVELRYMSELEYSEISRILDISEANARKLLSRGLAKIRKSFLKKGSV